MSLALPQALAALKPSGRLVVISFHSLEDRIVKNFMRGAARPTLPERLPVRARDLPSPKLRVIGRLVKPGAEEVRANPAREARCCASPKNPPEPVMTRLNLLLVVVLTTCALGLVTSQHQARKLFAELEQEQERSRQLEVRIRPVAARSKHVGGARTRRTHRQPPVAHAYPRRETPPDRPAAGGGEMNFAASPVLALTLPTWRSRLLLYLFITCFGLLLCRAVYLQGLNNDFLQAKGESRYSRVIEIPANRGSNPRSQR